MTSERIRITRNSLGEIVLEREGEEARTVKPVRALPLTDPHDWIGLMDEKGKPVHMVRSLAELDPESRAVLAQELQRVYFLPKILRIHQITEEYGVLRVEVETDKGPRVFEVRTREHIRFLPNGRVLMRDLDGNRYEVPCLGDLDAHSQMLAEVYL
jgi:Domain of unknown function (DUF1854)